MAKMPSNYRLGRRGKIPSPGLSRVRQWKAGGEATPEPEPDPAPELTSIAPTSGPIAGGTAITITGLHLTGATVVLFGSTPAASFAVTNDTTITATTPALTAAAYDVVVTTPAGTDTLSAAFTAEADEPVTGFRYYRWTPVQTNPTASIGAYAIGEVNLHQDPVTNDVQVVPTGPVIDPAETPAKVVDGSPYTGWVCFAGDDANNHLTYDFTTARIVKRVVLMAHAISATYSELAPIGWDLDGSNDLTSWTNVYTLRNDTTWPAINSGPGVPRTYNF